jgi:hypothetical protein
MQIIPLSNNEAVLGFTHKIVLTFADLTQSGAGTAQTINMLAVANKQVVTRVATRLDTAFQNTGDAAFNSTAITIGDSGSANRFIASQELNANGSSVSAKAGATINAYTAADNVAIVFTPTGGKSLNALNAGQLTVLVHLADMTVL